MLSRDGSVLALPLLKHYQRPLIITLFICAHSEAAKQCDKWALPCASACVVGVHLFMEIEGGGYMSSHLPVSSPVYTEGKKSKYKKFSAGRLPPVLWEQSELTCCSVYGLERNCPLSQCLQHKLGNYKQCWLLLDLFITLSAKNSMNCFIFLKYRWHVC